MSVQPGKCRKKTLPQLKVAGTSTSSTNSIMTRGTGPFTFCSALRSDTRSPKLNQQSAPGSMHWNIISSRQRVVGNAHKGKTSSFQRPSSRLAERAHPRSAAFTTHPNAACAVFLFFCCLDASGQEQVVRSWVSFLAVFVSSWLAFFVDFLRTWMNGHIDNLLLHSS